MSIRASKFRWLATALGLVTFTTLAACGGDDAPVGDDDPDPPDADVTQPDAPPGSETIRLNDDITEDTTFYARNTYVIPRLKQLFVKDGATLTIEPGTIIKGEQGALLVITRGSKIEAEGTAEAPIVFTSAQADNAKTRGFWGGVLICGDAPINTNVNSDPPSTEAIFEAFTSSIPEGYYGGTDADDDSGTLKYVRIEFTGFQFVAGREFNGLSLAGVGSGTEIDYIQSHAGADDGIEIWGGTVNLKHIVSSQNGDDGFDTDNGWNGKAQFMVIQHVNPDGSSDAANGYESDNHATSASYTAMPRTLPTIYNVTMIGKPDYAVGSSSFATVLRRGTGGRYFNHLVVGFPRGLEMRDSATAAQADAGNLAFHNSIIFGNDATGDGDNWPAPQAMNDIVEQTYFENAELANQFVDPGMDPDATSLTAPSFLPEAGSPALSGGATPPNDGFFDPTATFIGAMGTEDWTAGWTAYPQPAQ